MNKDLSEEECFHLFSCKCTSLNCLVNYEETIKTASGYQIEAKSKQRALCEIDAILYMIFAYYRLNKNEQALNNVDIVENLISACSDDGIEQRKSRLLADKALIFN